MIKAVVFDWGGVIAPNNEGGWVEAYAELLNVDFDEALAIWKIAYPGLNTGSISESDFWNKTRQLYIADLPENKHDIWKKGLAENVWPEMIDYIERLKQSGYAVALLSNTLETMFPNDNIENNYSRFNPIVLSHEVGFAKPSREIYDIMLDKLQLKASDCLFVDDMQKNIDAAKELGFQTLLAVDNPISNIREIDKLLNS